MGDSKHRAAIAPLVALLVALIGCAGATPVVPRRAPAPPPASRPARTPEPDAAVEDEPPIVVSPRRRAEDLPPPREPRLIGASREHERIFARESTEREGLTKFRWRCESTRHFIVFREEGAPVGEPLEAVEAARHAALERLGLTDERVPGVARLPLFVFGDEDHFWAAGITNVKWAAGCVARTWEGWRLVPTIYVCSKIGRIAWMMRHELAHVLGDEAFDTKKLPTWASEGIACFAEEEWLRRARAADVREEFSIVALQGLRLHALGGSDADTFYSRALVAFEALVRLAGSVEGAVTIAQRMGALGPAEGLSQAGLSVGELEAEIGRSFETTTGAIVTTSFAPVVTASATSKRTAGVALVGSAASAVTAVSTAESPSRRPASVAVGAVLLAALRFAVRQRRGRV